MARSLFNSANEPCMRLSALAIVLTLLAACGREPEQRASGGSNSVVDGALPTPAGASGGSVTGMPTSPPRVEAEPATKPAPEPVEGELAEGAEPADPNAIPIDPATGLAVGAQPTPPTDAPAVDTGAAGAVVREYMAALGSGSFAGAQQLWSTTPNDSPVLQLARGPTFAADMLPLNRADAAALAAGMASVPVQVRGTAEDGSERSLVVLYTVRRTADGAWRIASANVREGAP